ncbi:MAG: hypothetical protein AAF629_32425 [Chloroflexota bacterium]
MSANFDPKYLPPVSQTAIGSSYLIRQVAGSERMGGLQVTLRRRTDNAGSVSIEPTLWRTGDISEDSIVMGYGKLATSAIEEFITAHGLDLTAFDITLSHFLYHPLDSHPDCYRQAARSALRSALEALSMRDFPSS